MQKPPKQALAVVVITVVAIVIALILFALRPAPQQSEIVPHTLIIDVAVAEKQGADDVDHQADHCNRGGGAEFNGRRLQQAHDGFDADAQRRLREGQSGDGSDAGTGNGKN